MVRFPGTVQPVSGTLRRCLNGGYQLLLPFGSPPARVPDRVASAAPSEVSLRREAHAIPDSYDDVTREWSVRALHGCFTPPFPDSDPEGLHDTLRLRGVLSALTDVYSRTGARCTRDTIVQLLEWTVRLAERHPHVAWDTTTAALRIINIERTEDCLRRRRLSLFDGREWLRDFVTAHCTPLAVGHLCEPEGNHQLVNAVGRALCQRVLHRDTPIPARLLDEAADAVERQFLPDGGHIERAPHYHAQAVSLAARLVRLDARSDASWRRRIGHTLTRARRATPVLSDPNGAPLRFGDAGRNFSGQRPQLERADTNSAARARTLPQFGVGCWRWRAHGRELALYVDFGPPGLDGHPGHGHADALSFCFYVDGREAIADPGTYLYADHAEAVWFKSTAAHNTIVWPNADASELARFFRWSRVPPTPQVLHPGDDAILRVAQSWQVRDRRYRHIRAWRLLPDGFQVDDVIESAAGETAIHRLGLHPTTTIRDIAANVVNVSLPENDVVIAVTGESLQDCVVQPCWYAATYGARETSCALTWPFRTTAQRTVIRTTIRVAGGSGAGLHDGRAPR